MRSCSQHPDQPAAWTCAQCGKDLCERCAEGEPRAGLPAVVCVHCGGVARPILVPAGEAKKRRFPSLGAMFGQGSAQGAEMVPAIPGAIPRGRRAPAAGGSAAAPWERGERGAAGAPAPAEASVAPWERPGGAATHTPAVERSVAPWEQPHGGPPMAEMEESIPLDGDEGPRASSFDFGGASPDTPLPSSAFELAEESIPLDDDLAGPRGIRPGMDPAPQAGPEDPFAPTRGGPAAPEPRPRRGPPARPGLDERAAARFDDTPEPIPIVDIPQPTDQDIAAALHVGPGGTMSGTPTTPAPSRGATDSAVDHQPPAEDFAPQTLGGEPLPSSETSLGDAAAISVTLDAGALDNPLRMALESGDPHSALMNYREQMALGQPPALPPELEMRLAGMLEHAGQFGDAVMACKRASERDPEGPLAAQATFDGARILVERLGNRAQGLALLQYLLRHYADAPAAERARQLVAQIEDR